ncbi:hypothetical protein V8C86DRAFT_3085181 [Haematococcus lacustris]
MSVVSGGQGAEQAVSLEVGQDVHPTPPCQPPSPQPQLWQPPPLQTTADVVPLEHEWVTLPLVLNPPAAALTKFHQAGLPAPPASLQLPVTTVPLGPQRVAAGGTFDRLHCGHELLLSSLALVATEKVFIGITAEQLLLNKQHRELLQPYAERERAAVEYMRAVRPGLLVASLPALRFALCA